MVHSADSTRQILEDWLERSMKSILRQIVDFVNVSTQTRSTAAIAIAVVENEDVTSGLANSHDGSCVMAGGIAGRRTVVFVTTHEVGTSVGGVEQRLANLSTALVRRGVDLRFFRVPGTDAREAARNALRVPSQQVVMLCPRRWAPTKGVLYLAEAIAALPVDVARRCTFIFAGSANDGYPVYRQQVYGALGRKNAAPVNPSRGDGLAQDLTDRGLIACSATDAHDAALRVPRSIRNEWGMSLVAMNVGEES